MNKNKQLADKLINEKDIRTIIREIKKIKDLDTVGEVSLFVFDSLDEHETSSEDEDKAMMVFSLLERHISKIISEQADEQESVDDVIVIPDESKITSIN